MSSAIVDLRTLLANRFPQVRLGVSPRKETECLATGIAALDDLLSGGFPRGEITELIGAGTGSGTVEIIHELLRRVAMNRQFLALVDGKNSFDAVAVEPAFLNRLLWVRCAQASEALKATDLLLRDRNFHTVVIDLKLNPVRELRKIPSSTWHRYGRLVEQNATTLLVITSQQLVNVAACRVAVDSGLGIDALSRSRTELLACLRFKLLRSSRSLNAEVTAQAG